MKFGRAILVALLCVFAVACQAHTDLTRRSDVDQFIDAMVKQHGFSRADLIKIFRQVEIHPEIIDTIARPAESKPWYAYRSLFVTKDRISGGVAYWKANAAALAAAEKRYGVAPQYIVAILGVETRYGRNTGGYRVIDALSTLAFDYPPRGAFFRKELEQYLLMIREEGLGPFKLTGSYAGAMGSPQFMPSSFRSYAVDFDGDGKRNLWNDNRDIIGSIANYFKVHGWIDGGLVAMPALVHGTRYKALLDLGLKPQTEAGKLRSYDVTSQSRLPADMDVALLELENHDGPEEWVTFNNFYVITRYNRSPLYAMAVYQLSKAIREAKENDGKALTVFNDSPS